MSNIILFEDIFVVDKLDQDGKKFDKVSRIEARSQNCDMCMPLDVNIELYPMRVGDKFTMALGHTLNLDGTLDSGHYTPVGIASLVDFSFGMKNLNTDVKFFAAKHDLALPFPIVLQGGRKSLADKYEYVMHGKLFKLSDECSGRSLKAERYVSYGGLLMMLKGDPSYVS